MGRSQVKQRIFVSHSHADNTFCQRLVGDLRRILGDDDAVWMDVSGDLQGGEAWWTTIRQELRDRPIALVILSPDAVASSWVNSEVDIAWKLRQSQRERIIIPILWRPCEVRDDLDTLHIISFAAPRQYDTAFAQLCAALNLRLPVMQPVAATTAPTATSAKIGQSASSPKLVATPKPISKPKPQPAEARRGRGNTRVFIALAALMAVVLSAALVIWKPYKQPQQGPQTGASQTRTPNATQTAILANGFQTATALAVYADHEVAPGCGNPAFWQSASALHCNGNAAAVSGALRSNQLWPYIANSTISVQISAWATPSTQAGVEVDWIITHNSRNDTNVVEAIRFTVNSSGEWRMTHTDGYGDQFAQPSGNVAEAGTQALSLTCSPNQCIGSVNGNQVVTVERKYHQPFNTLALMSTDLNQGAYSEFSNFTFTPQP